MQHPFEIGDSTYRKPGRKLDKDDFQKEQFQCQVARIETRNRVGKRSQTVITEIDSEVKSAQMDDRKTEESSCGNASQRIGNVKTENEEMENQRPERQNPETQYPQNQYPKRQTTKHEGIYSNRIENQHINNRRIESRQDKPMKIESITNQQPINTENPTPTDYLERIPIVGMNNLARSKTKFGRWFWTITMILSAAASFFYLIPSVVRFTRHDIVVEVQRVLTDPGTPFPNIYVCIGDDLNMTYIGEYFGIEPHKISLAVNTSRTNLLSRRFGPNKEDLAFAAYTYSYTYPLFLDWVDQLAAGAPMLNEVIYRSVLAMGSKWKGLSYLHLNSLYPCRSVLSKCELNGVTFPCCPDGATGITAGTNGCYKINATAAIRNFKPGSDKNVLSFESLVNLENMQDFGIRPESSSLSLLYGNHLDTLFDAPDGIAAGTLTHARLKSKRRLLLSNCMSHYEFAEHRHQGIADELKEYFQNMSQPGQYSIQKCMFAQMLQLFSISCGCVIQYDTLYPNDSSVCTPAHLYACFYYAFRSAAPIRVNNGVPKDMFQHLKNEAVECLPLCDTWHYEAQYTFQPLGGEKDDTSSNTDMLYNKVIITLDDEYLIEQDVYEMDRYEFLGLLGLSLGMFMGLSLVALVQVVYWSIAAIMLMRKNQSSNLLTRKGAVKEHQ